MFQRVLATLLICLILATGFSRLFVQAGFHANRKYIAEKLCENRSRPWLHCNGHCYLMKKLKQAEEKERNTNHRLQKTNFQDFFYSAVPVIHFEARLLQVIPVCNQQLFIQPIERYLLRPPQQA